MDVHDSVLELVGNTPLVRLNRITDVLSQIVHLHTRAAALEGTRGSNRPVNGLTRDEPRGNMAGHTVVGRKVPHRAVRG